MYLEHAVLAGVIAVGSMLSVFAGLSLLIWKDPHTRTKKED